MNSSRFSHSLQPVPRSIATALGFTLTVVVALAGPYGRGLDSGLRFDDSSLVWTDPAAGGPYHGLRTAVLVHHEDLPAHNHHSNSSMASLFLHEVSTDGGIRAHDGDANRELVFIVLQGNVRFTIGDRTLDAQTHDVVVAPPGSRRGFEAAGGPARVLQAEWNRFGGEGAGVSPAPLLTSERLRPLAHTDGAGYITVEGNHRQNENPLSIIAYGAGHINSSNALLLYPTDLAVRNFKANTTFARMGMSAYHPGGGTKWHFHPEREQAFVIVSGNALFEIGGNTLEAKPGDIFFAPRHVGHAYKTTGEEPFKFFELEWGR